MKRVLSTNEYKLLRIKKASEIYELTPRFIAMRCLIFRDNYVTGQHGEAKNVLQKDVIRLEQIYGYRGTHETIVSRHKYWDHFLANSGHQDFEFIRKNFVLQKKSEQLSVSSIQRTDYIWKKVIRNVGKIPLRDFESMVKKCGFYCSPLHVCGRFR